MTNIDFDFWLKIRELREIWIESILQLKFINKINENHNRIYDELESWNDAFDNLFKTNGVNWVAIALSLDTSVYSKNTEAFATILSESLADAYMCMDKGNFLGRKTERGIESNARDCKTTREAFLKILDKDTKEKTNWFASVVSASLRRRSEGYFQRSKIIRSSRGRRIDYDEFIRSNTNDNAVDDDSILNRKPTTGGFIPGSGNVIDSEDEENRTFGDESGEATTLMNAIREKILSMVKRPDDLRAVRALKLLDMISSSEIESLNWNDVKDKLDIHDSKASDIMNFIRKATLLAKEELGLLPGLRLKKKPKKRGQI